MRRSLLVSAALVTLTSFADSVAAQQTSRTQQPQRTAPSPPPPNWSGQQVGVFGGGNVMPMNFVEPGAILCTTGLTPVPPFCSETPFGFSGTPIRPTFGVFAGYNSQYGNMVAGVEVDAAWKRGSISGSLATVTAICGCVSATTRNESFFGSMTQGWDGSARLRYGTLITPWTLAYATAGVALGSVCGSFSYGATISSGLGAFGAGSWCDLRIGYTAGGGVETQPNSDSDVKIRFEYRYTDFGSFSKDVPLAVTACGGAVVVCVATAHIDMRAASHTFRVGLGFPFGGSLASLPFITQ